MAKIWQKMSKIWFLGNLFAFSKIFIPDLLLILKSTCYDKQFDIIKLKFHQQLFTQWFFMWNLCKNHASAWILAEKQSVAAYIAKILGKITIFMFSKHISNIYVFPRRILDYVHF